MNLTFNPMQQPKHISEIIKEITYRIQAERDVTSQTENPKELIARSNRIMAYENAITIVKGRSK